MTKSSDRNPPPYKALGDVLLSRLGPGQSLSWLADLTVVSKVAVSLWMSGKCRPKPKRLGYIAAILRFNEEDLPTLASLAKYETGSDEELQVHEGYQEWYALRQRWELETMEQNIRYRIGDNIITLINADMEVRRMFRQKYPDIIEMAAQATA